MFEPAPLPDVPPKGAGRDGLKVSLIVALTVLLLGQAALLGFTIAQIAGIKDMPPIEAPQDLAD